MGLNPCGRGGCQPPAGTAPANAAAAAAADSPAVHPPVADRPTLANTCRVCGDLGAFMCAACGPTIAYCRCVRREPTPMHSLTHSLIHLTHSATYPHTHTQTHTHTHKHSLSVSLAGSVPLTADAPESAGLGTCARTVRRASKLTGLHTGPYAAASNPATPKLPPCLVRPHPR
jgi:hypothetical protein